MNKTETHEQKETLFHGALEIKDKEIESLVKEVGAKTHTFNISLTILFGVPIVTRYSIDIEFDDGRKFGYSTGNWRDCLIGIKELICGREKSEIVNIGGQKIPLYIDDWKKYPDEKPTEYGRYLVHRNGCNKTHFETWNGSGWAYNNKDITNWTLVKAPDDSK